ncbi:MAG: cation:proton antiporter, partial [Candidatus Aenigmatarchaeota archaeon]
FKVMRSLPATLAFSLGVMTLTIVALTLLFSLLGLPLITAAIVALILAGTTTDVVTALASKLSIKHETRQLMVFESIINDLQIVPFFLLLHIAGNTGRAADVVLFTLLGIPLAIIVGAVIAIGWVFAIGRYLGKHPLNYAATIGILFVLYQSIQMLGGNGAVAVLAFSFVLGNAIGLFDRWHIRNTLRRKLTPRVMKDFRQIEVDISFFVRTIFFVFLGAIFSFRALRMDVFFLVLITIAAILISRFVSSYFLARRVHRYHDAAGPLTWIMPRGYVAAVLAFAAVGSGIITNGILDMILLTIYATTLISIAYAVYHERKRKLPAPK